jgi:outer membrane protein TolC
MLNLIGGYGYTYAGDTGSWDDNWSVTVALTLRLYDFGKVQASIREKQSQAEQVKLAVAQLEDAIELEVRKAFWDMQAAEEQLAAQQLNIEQAKEALAIAISRYAGGTITQTELLDAQLALTQAELGHTGALYAHAVARAALVKAMGAD